MDELSRYGSRTLNECEDAIVDHLDGASTAYREIKERKLYKDTHSRWEEYCEQRWGMSVDKVDRIIATERLIETVAEIPQMCGKISQTVAAELKDLPPTQQREVISKVKATGKKPTAAVVKQVRQEVAPKPETEKPEVPKEELPADGKPTGSMLARIIMQIRLACKEADGWLHEESRVEVADELEKWIKRFRVVTVEAPKANGRFKPPTQDEVAAYITEKDWSNVVDAEDFIAHYSANGWRTGKGGIPMKDWRAAVLTWVKMRKNDPKGKGRAIPDDYGKAGVLS